MRLQARDLGLLIALIDRLAISKAALIGNSIGGRSQRSTFPRTSASPRASASVRKQWAFRHSLRKRSLKASMKVSSVDLPKRESRRRAQSDRFERHAPGVGPEIKVAADELAALIDADRLRIVRPGADTFKGANHVPAGS